MLTVLADQRHIKLAVIIKHNKNPFALAFNKPIEHLVCASIFHPET